VTTFFVLSQDPMGRWDWHARQPRPPQPL